MQITAAGYVDGNSGRSIVRTASGDIYAVIPQDSDSSGSNIEVFESTDGGATWVQQDAAGEPATAYQYTAVSAAIDGNGVIHIAYFFLGRKYALRYVTFSTITNTFSGDTSVASTGLPSVPRTAIAVDSNNVPHILYEANTRSGGNTVTYIDMVGGKWNSPVAVVPPSGSAGCAGDILIDENNIPEISYLDCGTTGEIYAAIGNANQATSFTSQSVGTADGYHFTQAPMIAMDVANNTWVAFEAGDGSSAVPALVEHYAADSWTTWSTPALDSSASVNTYLSWISVGLAVYGTTPYVAYEPASSTYGILWQSYNGSSWSTGGGFTAGCEAPELRWSEYFDYHSSEVDALLVSTSSSWDEIPSGPMITGLSPTSGIAGTSVTVSGTSFGSTQGSITFGGIEASIQSWTDTSVVATVPSGISPGTIFVVAYWPSGNASNAVSFTVPAPPVISSLSPTSGNAGTTSVTISGTDFGSSQGSSTVTFNGVLGTPTSWSDTSIVVTVPTNATTGPVVVTGPGGPSNGVAFTVIPVVSSISPVGGGPGTFITISGSGFGATQGGSTVTFNGTGGFPETWNATTIVAAVPGYATSGPVVVTVGGITSNSNVDFALTTTGTIEGTVTQAGSAVSGAMVEAIQGGVVKGSTTTTSEGSYAISALVAGTYDVSVFPNGSLSASQTGVLVLAGQTTTVNLFVGTPTISSLSPSAGPLGSAVTISGSNFGAFQGSSTVTFNGVLSTPTSWNSTTIIVPVPQNATTGPVVVSVAAIASNGMTFTVGTGTISGTVTASSDGSAISGATVDALQSSVVRATATTGADGSYSLTTLNPGTYDLRVSASGYGTALQTGLSVTAGGSTPADVSLSAAGTLSGTVTQSDGTTGITGATVTLQQGADTVATATTDSSGNYSIATLSAGSFTVQASATGYDTKSQTGVSVTAGQTTTQNFSLNGQSTISYFYDDLGRLIGASDSQSNTATYAYDAVGNLLSIGLNVTTRLSVAGFSPESGPVGTSVTLSGTGFNADPTQDTVTFNGTSATVTSATATQIVATAPYGATTGPISVTVAGGSVTSSQSFTVTGSTGAPTIASFTPSVGTAGTTVSINGTNFDSSPTSDAVAFNSNAATVSSANATTLSTTVPVSGTSGHITVTTPSGKAVSSADFFVPPATYTGANVGYTGRITIGGSSGTITVGTSGQIGLIVFDGTAGQQVSLSISSNTNNCNVSILDPSGATIAGPVGFGTGNGFLDTWTLPITGTYTILVVETGSATGSLSLALNPVAATAGPTIVIGGPAVPVNIQTPGQNVELTFNATANQHISLNSTPDASTPLNGNYYISIIRPDGVTLVGPVDMGSGGGFIDTQTLPFTGTYTILVNPVGSATGITDLSLYNVVNTTGSLTPSSTGAQTTLNLNTPGQNAYITFSATAGERISLKMSNVSIASSQVSIQNPTLGPLTAGQSYSIKMEYFQSINGSEAQLEWSSPSTAKEIIPESQLTPPSGTTGTGLEGDYYNDTDLNGGPSYKEIDPTINFNWNGSSPGGSIPGTNWSARWTGTVQAQYSEQYTFCTNTDDGARLWMNGILIIDEWVGQGLTEWCSGQPTNLVAPVGVGTGGGFIDTVTIPATGTYTIVVNPQAADTGNTTLTLYEVPADYTNSATPGGTPVTVSTVTPGQNGDVTFSATAGQQVSLQMTGVSISQSNVSIQNPTLGPLTAGQSYPVEMDYFQASGTSAAQLEWASPSTLKEIVPQSQLTPPGGGTGTGLEGDYYPNTSLSGTPDMTETDPTIDFNWNGNSPGDSLPGTNWSARWTGTVQAQYSEQYTFCTNTDDGARLWVNGILIIDKWVGQGLTEWCSGQPTNLVAPVGVGTGGGFIDTVTIPATGTYTIVVNPQSADIGDMTLTLYNVPPDASGSLTLNGSSTTVTTTTPGQNAQVTFSGSAGQLATVQLTGNTMGCVAVSLEPPGGGTALTSSTQCGSSFALAQQTLPTTGTYIIYINPQGTHYGSVTVAATSP